MNWISGQQKRLGKNIPPCGGLAACHFEPELFYLNTK